MLQTIFLDAGGVLMFPNWSRVETALGSAVLRHILTVGHCAAPDQETVAAWDAAETIAGIYHWPHKIAAAALSEWAAAHGGTDGRRRGGRAVPVPGPTT